MSVDVELFRFSWFVRYKNSWVLNCLFVLCVFAIESVYYRPLVPYLDL